MRNTTKNNIIMSASSFIKRTENKLIVCAMKYEREYIDSEASQLIRKPGKHDVLFGRGGGKLLDIRNSSSRCGVDTSTN